MKVASSNDFLSPGRQMSPVSVVKNVIEPNTNKRGHKIQARSLTIYNAILPTRDEVRKENYERRHDQMASMGFRTPINVPYRIIGEPIHLDSRQFTLYNPHDTSVYLKIIYILISFFVWFVSFFFIFNFN